MPCMLCEREMALTKHHLLPRELGGKEEDVILICSDCHRQIHVMYTNRELALRLSSIQALKQDENFAKFLILLLSICLVYILIVFEFIFFDKDLLMFFMTWISCVVALVAFILDKVEKKVFDSLLLLMVVVLTIQMMDFNFIQKLLKFLQI